MSATRSVTIRRLDGEDVRRSVAAVVERRVRGVRRAGLLAASRGAWPRSSSTMIGVGMTGRRLPAAPAARGVQSRRPGPSMRAREPRQLQFATPGGTRIIWIFDPDSA